jgi:uncharacterized protein YkwD
MYRVALLAFLSIGVAGCSLGSSLGSFPSLGFGDSSSTPPASASGSTGSIMSAKRTARSDLGRDRAPAKAPAAGTRTASADDKAPAGSFEHAPAGALADRDYSHTQLDAHKAVQLINAYRRQMGLKPVKLSAELTMAAKRHSMDLARWDRISHYGSDGSNPWDRVKRTPYKAKLAAENVGTGQVSFDEVLKGWKASPSHDKNLKLAEAEHVGIALVYDPKTEFRTFWTLVLAAPM